MKLKMDYRKAILAFLPFFGVLSDRAHSKLGRRTPFILWGTLDGALRFIRMCLAGIVFLFLNKKLATPFGGFFNLIALSALIMLIALGVYIRGLLEGDLRPQVFRYCENSVANA